jgi:hypothetical protein
MPALPHASPNNSHAALPRYNHARDIPPSINELSSALRTEARAAPAPAPAPPVRAPCGPATAQ